MYVMEEARLKLYIRNDLISNRFNDLLMRWMNFIKGVVHSNNLKLSVNRETLQGNKIIISIGKKCQKKVLGKHVKMEAQEDNMTQKKLMKNSKQKKIIE